MQGPCLDQTISEMIATGTKRYSLFGGILRTTLVLPELHPAPETVQEDWTLTVYDDIAPSVKFEWSADEMLAGNITVRLERASDGRCRLTYSDTGTFDISGDGAHIVWYRASGAPEDLARTDILGRVISLAMQSNGVLMLHASAVSTNNEVIGFLAPKFFGKSTLACALTDAGARLVTDDALALRVAGTVMCAPGVPAIRLRRESAEFLRGPGTADASLTGWRHVERRDISETLQRWEQLGALYILQPSAPEEMSDAATRSALSGSEAAVSLVRFAKLANLLRGTLAVEYLGMAAAIASQAKIYTLQFARDLGQLNTVADTILRWHAGTAAVNQPVQ